MAVKPNFFIVGAPKCGTTALYEYLRPHPHIFMPAEKEPHFFATDLNPYPIVKTLEKYLQLFQESTEQHLRVGEGSVQYLRSSAAIPRIYEFNPDAKIIAMLRNPVDMVYSYHSEILDWGIEDESDFGTAWRLQERRSRGLDLPPGIASPLLVQYADIGRLAEQTQRLLSIFPPSQVKLILYDDFASAPQRVYAEVLEFLEVPHDGRTEFPRINENRRARLPWLRELYRKPPAPLRGTFRALKRLIGTERVVAGKKRIVDLNTVKERRPPLSPELRAELVQEFRDDVALLSQILHRDLSHWA